MNRFLYRLKSKSGYSNNYEPNRFVTKNIIQTFHICRRECFDWYFDEQQMPRNGSRDNMKSNYS